MPFSPVGFWTPPGGAAPTVSALATNISHTSIIGTVYTSTSYNSDGNEYTNSPSTALNYTSSRGNAWLTGGSSSDVWVQCTLNTGSFNEVNAGTGTRLNLGTTRNWAVSDSNPTAGSKGEANATWAFYDAASGGNLLDSVTYTITAAYTDSCPTCCFTPETLVTMADGSLIPISEVQVGDMIRVMNGIEQITEVITRVSRPMCRLTFANGKELLLTSDHPVFVEGKGYASVRPQMEYKDAGQVKQLETGDFVVTDTGLRIRITSITPYDYLDTVYTLGNKHFFAGGILVY